MMKIKLYSIGLPAVAVIMQVPGCQTVVPAIKDYCTTYNRVVLTQAERAEIKQLSRTIRTRIQGNDLDYLCRCIGWADPICRGRKG